MLKRLVVTMALAVTVAACGDDAAPGSFPECEEIAEACHPVDPGSGPIHDCHEGAEVATTAQMCIDSAVTCLPLCHAAQDAGVPDGASSDAP